MGINKIIFSLAKDKVSCCVCCQLSRLHTGMYCVIYSNDCDLIYVYIHTQIGDEHLTGETVLHRLLFLR